MSVSVACKKCGKELRSKDEYAGWQVKCPACGTVNRLPSRPDTGLAATGAQPAVCRLCGKDFAEDSSRVKDTQGRYYHRSCHEAAKHRQQARQAASAQGPAKPTSQAVKPATCHLCGKDFSQDASQVKDTQGRYYHRSCHEAAKRRQQAQRAAPGQGVAKPAGPPVGQAADLGSPPAAPDLWGELPAESPLQPSGAVLPTRPASGQKQPWLYVMIGVGCAVPVGLLLFIVVRLMLPESDQRRGPVASVEATSTTVESSEDAAVQPPDASGGDASEDTQTPPPPPPPPAETTATPPPPPKTSWTPPPRPPTFPRPYPGRRPPRTIPQRTAPMPRDLSATSPDFGKLLLAEIIVLGIAIVVFGPISAGTLMLTCKICKVEMPGFGKAWGIVIAILVAQRVANWGLIAVMGTPKDLSGALALIGLSLTVTVLIAAAIYSGALETSFGGGLLVCIVHGMLTLPVLMVFCCVLVTLLSGFAALVPRV